MILFIFDFDNTLGDTYGPHGEGNIFRTKTLPDVEKATEIYEKYRRWADDIVVYPKLLEEYGITDPQAFFINAGMSEQLYDDVVPFFIKLREHPEIQTVILTTGDEEFQRIKVHVTGVDSLVDEVFITRKRNKAENIREIIKQYQPMHTIFIDDHINISPEDFDTPITIYEMNRANTKLWANIIHSLGEIPLNEILWK
jgi:FMN phosphatase YigB (HAD superfamily)